MPGSADPSADPSADTSAGGLRSAGGFGPQAEALAYSYRNRSIPGARSSARALPGAGVNS
jgi:hypothetical protein